ncbi:hypothetical protein NUW54_g9646 [Trametes sanguinea]|uniref:Uncharacterized protein n=1 Tax=Trametes sanguinea TaxID=158606 RepID=A0ACC1P581_9APHY|nr:hypothetical protein NUW54_g9646 [Trametes sanguinea]
MTSSEPSSSSSPAVVHHHHADHGEERMLTILYATETGTAQDVADRLARLCRGLRIRARVHSMDAYPQVYGVIRDYNVCKLMSGLRKS